MTCSRSVQVRNFENFQENLDQGLLSAFAAMREKTKLVNDMFGRWL